MILLLPFLAAFCAGLALTPLVRRWARAHSLVAVPRADRWHVKATALFGGVAIFGAVACGVVAIMLTAPETVLAEWKITAGIVSGATWMFITGLLDDKVQLRPATKLVMQVIGAGMVVSLGVVYPVTAWAPLNIVLTMFWFLALTNAINLLDNMDGVATGVTCVAAMFLCTVFALDGAWLLAGIAAALAGATLGFLPFNFSPASIFMGDSGSLLLGALLASLGATYPAAASGSVISVLFVPVFVVVIPLMDTVLVTLTRTIAGRPVSVGGRDHTTHRLVAMGLSVRSTALLLYAFAIGGGLLALLVRSQDTRMSLLTGSLFLIGLGILAAYLGRMHKYEPVPHATPRRRTLLVSNLLYKKRLLEVSMDVLLFAAAYTGAYLLRFDGSVPAAQLVLLEKTLAVAVVSKSAAFALSGVYRVDWNQITLRDLHRLTRAVALGSVIGLGIIFFADRDASIARAVLAIDAILALVLVLGARASFRSLDVVRQSLVRGGSRAVIYGAGRAGELVARELLSNAANLGIEPIGYVDDDVERHGRLLYGLPVVGGAGRLSEMISRREVDVVVVAIRHADAARLTALSRLCTAAGLRLLRFELSFLPVYPEHAFAPAADPVIDAPRAPEKRAIGGVA